MATFEDVFDDYPTIEDVNSVSPYTTKISAPIYEPKNVKPYIHELYSLTKTNELISDITEDVTITEDERLFLINAARRHTVFNYEKIADYYASSSSSMKNLMEKSALVIIDFNKAIENNFIILTDELNAQYKVDHG